MANIINPGHYINALNPMRARLQRASELKMDMLRQCSAEAVATHVPIITVLLFALRPDVLGEVKELRECLGRRLKDSNSPTIVEWSDL